MPHRRSWHFYSITVLLCNQYFTACSQQAPACSDDDWQFAFGVCNAEHKRSVFPYAPTDGRCDPRHPESRLMPDPLHNVSCMIRCPAGSRLTGKAEPSPSAASADRSIVTVRCGFCPEDSFSLGGGFRISGPSKDWARPWPMELSTSCIYQDSNSKWVEGGHAVVCVLRVQAPTGLRGNYETRASTWNAKLSEAALSATSVVLSPLDVTGCQAINGSAADVIRGKILLVERGDCLFETKAWNAAHAGAIAVVVFNSRPTGGLFHPAARHGNKTPPVPMFMISYADGELWLSAMRALQQVFVGIPSTQCVLKSEANSTIHPQGQNVSDSSSVANLRHRGCEAWMADSSGAFLYSGNNHRFHQLYSILTLGVRFVRDGHLIFRYRVDAENGYDGLSVVMDWNEKLKLTSKQLEYKEMKIDIPRGSHSLRFEYAKDWSYSHGDDRAQIEFLEVVGTAHADLECLPCHSRDAHSTKGASQCTFCLRNHFLDSLSATERNFNRSACRECPTGTWAPSGSIGNSSCRVQEPCRQEDVEVDAAVCINNQQVQTWRWREPRICSITAPGAYQLPTSAQMQVQCLPCQPSSWRPTGGECEPLRLTCSQGQYALKELLIRYWNSWPDNFSSQVLDSSGQELKDAGSPRGWSARGPYAQVGGDAQAALEHGIASARLHFDVEMEQADVVSFAMEVSFWNAWALFGGVLIDQVRVELVNIDTMWGASAAELRNGSAPLGPQAHIVLVRLQVEAGLHRITWVWNTAPYTEQDLGVGQYGPDGVGQATLRLWNVSATHARGGGMKECRWCPAGQEAMPNRSGCRRCPPGTSSSGSGLPCTACPAGTFAPSNGSTFCRDCAAGMHSNARASVCEPLPFLQTSGLTFNVSAAMEAWALVFGKPTLGSIAPGPFEIEHHHYYLSLFAPTRTPNANPGGTDEDEGLALWWEVVGTQSLGQSGGSVCSWDRTGNSFHKIGGTLGAMNAFMDDRRHGLRMQFLDGEVCTGSAERRKASFVFECDPIATPDKERMYLDNEGHLHIAKLRFHEDSTTKPFWQQDCSDIVLEWRTSAACPMCKEEHFAKRVGPCLQQGRRDVWYEKTGPHAHYCVGGARPPLPSQEHCEMEINIGGLPLFWWITVMVALLLSCCLCVHICRLQRKYAKYLQLEEQTGEAAVIGMPRA